MRGTAGGAATEADPHQGGGAVEGNGVETGGGSAPALEVKRDVDTLVVGVMRDEGRRGHGVEAGSVITDAVTVKRERDQRVERERHPLVTIKKN